MSPFSCTTFEVVSTCVVTTVGVSEVETSSEVVTVSAVVRSVSTTTGSSGWFGTVRVEVTSCLVAVETVSLLSRFTLSEVVVLPVIVLLVPLLYVIVVTGVVAVVTVLIVTVVTVVVSVYVRYVV